MPEKSRNWVAVLNTLHQSDRLNRVSEGAELLYRRLLEVVDNGGNYFADPSLLLGYIFAHRMSTGLTPKDMMDRMQELVGVGLLDVYADGKLLHISRYYTRLRSDGHGSDIRFASFPGKPNPAPDSDRTPPGVHPVSTESEIDSESEERERQKRKRPCADDSESSAPGKRKRRYSDEERKKIDKNVCWFYARYLKAVGSHSPQEPKPGRFPHPADARAALKLSGLLEQHKPDRIDAMLKDWLAGKYLSVPGDTLASFVSCFGKLLNPASRKREWVNETPGAERARSTGPGGFKRVGELLPPEARNG